MLPAITSVATATKPSNLAAPYRSFYFAQDENPTFQIRSSWAQFSRFERFQLFYFSITYVFSMNMNIPTPTVSTSAIFRWERVFYLALKKSFHCSVTPFDSISQSGQNDWD
jgi:hypothetical protein